MVRDPEGLEAEALSLESDLLDIFVGESELGLDLDAEVSYGCYWFKGVIIVVAKIKMSKISFVPPNRYVTPAAVWRIWA